MWKVWRYSLLKNFEISLCNKKQKKLDFFKFRVLCKYFEIYYIILYILYIYCIVKQLQIEKSILCQSFRHIYRHFKTFWNIAVRSKIQNWTFFWFFFQIFFKNGHNFETVTHTEKCREKYFRDCPVDFKTLGDIAT